MRGGSLQSRTRVGVTSAVNRRPDKEADDPVVRSLNRHMSHPATQSLEFQGLGPASRFKVYRTPSGWSGAGRVTAVTWFRMRGRVTDRCRCAGGERCALAHRGTEGHQHKFSAVFRCLAPVVATVEALVSPWVDEPAGDPPSAVVMRAVAGRQQPFTVVLGRARPWHDAVIVGAGNAPPRGPQLGGLWSVGHDWHAQRSYEE